MCGVIGVAGPRDVLGDLGTGLFNLLVAPLVAHCL